MRGKKEGGGGGVEGVVERRCGENSIKKERELEAIGTDEVGIVAFSVAKMSKAGRMSVGQ